ncbi:hypothetical protein [Escherichia phage PH1062]|nr:hypothetical protein [Escherichia phage PH1062]
MGIENLIKAFEFYGIINQDAYIAAYRCEHIHDEVKDGSFESYKKAVFDEMAMWNEGHYEY